MPGMSDRVYVTTPIYYVNDRPHIGHVYTTTICDVYARFQRLAGREVFFLTGTDEHGIKVEKSAAAAGLDPQALADRNAAEFQRVLGRFDLTNDDFIRTTQPRHVRQVRAIVQRLIDSGDVYPGQYEGWYDEGQEEFIPEMRAREQQYKSAVSGKPLVRMKEENYFFRLSAYQQRLEQLYAQQPLFVRPESRRNEMLGRLRDGLADIPVSRTSFSWGIRIPTNDKHVLWVWLDALANYITALGMIDTGPDEFSRSENEKGPDRDLRAFWPATYHVIGKEILFFHALFWPAMLMALKLPLPRCIYAHSFWISEGQKMSKSLGNFIDLEAIDRYVGTYGLDAWRYYMVSHGPLGATDADFAAAHFHEVYHTDLVNTVGNCASRVTAMIGKYFDGQVPPYAGPDERARAAASEEGPDRPVTTPGFDWPSIAADAVKRVADAMDRFDLAGALAEALALIRRVDAYINATEPFKLARDPANRDRLATILYECAEAVRIASVLLTAVLPSKMAELWTALGLSPSPDILGESRGEGAPGDADSRAAAFARLVRWGGLKPGAKVMKVALFPRIEQSPLAPAAAS
jgi:methionyl-tRNA synthetase